MPAASLPHPAAPNLLIRFVDNWNDQGAQMTQTGMRRRWHIQVGGGRTLRICLGYTDRPGRALQNNLNLFVQDSTGRKYMGNEQRRFSMKIPDVDNNAEIVRIEAPPPGKYWIQVTASNLLQAPQDFALVVTGDLTGDLVRND
jgi:hypothetical protein